MNSFIPKLLRQLKTAVGIKSPDQTCTLPPSKATISEPNKPLQRELLYSNVEPSIHDIRNTFLFVLATTEGYRAWHKRFGVSILGTSLQGLAAGAFPPELGEVKYALAYGWSKPTFEIEKLFTSYHQLLRHAPHAGYQIWMPACQYNGKLYIPQPRPFGGPGELNVISDGVFSILVTEQCVGGAANYFSLIFDISQRHPSN